MVLATLFAISVGLNREKFKSVSTIGAGDLPSYRKISNLAVQFTIDFPIKRQVFRRNHI